MTRKLTILMLMMLLLFSCITGCGSSNTAAPASANTGSDQSESEVAYLANVSAIIKELPERMDEVCEYIGEPDMGSPEWKEGIAVPIGAIISCDEKLKSTTPPEYLLPAHQELVEGSKNFRSSVEHLAKGIDNEDASEIQMATIYMQQGYEKMASAKEKFSELSVVGDLE